MRTRLVKWLCIVVLSVAFVLWKSIADYELLVRLVICSGAAVVAVQAFHSTSKHWGICFLAVALLFNPAIPVFPLSDWIGLGAVAFAGAAFALSLTRLKSQPLLSMPSITDRTPGSESL